MRISFRRFEVAMHLTVDKLVKNYGTKQVLKGASFTFESGKIYGLLGRNGAGKTTLFQCLAEQTKYQQGQCVLEKQDSTNHLTSEQVALVCSESFVPDFLTGYELIRFFLTLYRPHMKSSQIDTELAELFELVQLSAEDRHRLLKDYSHGMKSKVLMLLNLLQQKEVLLLDEPLSSVDVVAGEELKQLIKHSKDNRITILSTHLLDLALELCDEIVLLRGGVLEPLKRQQLDDSEYRKQIIATLKEES